MKRGSKLLMMVAFVQTGMAEDMDVLHDEPLTGEHNFIVAVPLGHGHQAKVVSTRHRAA